jgi:hypothetical protein
MGVEGERRVAFEGSHERDDILTLSRSTLRSPLECAAGRGQFRSVNCATGIVNNLLRMGTLNSWGCSGYFATALEIR